MKPFRNKFSSIIWRFLGVLTRCHVGYFFIVAVFFPITVKAIAFPAWHDAENIGNKCINIDIFDKGVRVLLGLGQVKNNILKCSFKYSAQPIIFGSINCLNGGVNSDKTAYNTTNQSRSKSNDNLSLRHIVLLLIAAIAGGFTGLIILFLFLKYFI